MDWNDVAREIDISPESLRAIRKGRNGPKEITARALDDWLDWEPGSTEQLFAGGEPAPRRDTSPSTAVDVTWLDEGRLELTVIVNPDDPEPAEPPGGLRDQVERIIWAIDEPWHVRWAQIQARRAAQAPAAPSEAGRRTEGGR